MSSDDEQTQQSGKRKKEVLPDSEDSDESVVQSHRRKKIFRVISEGESSDEDSDVQRPVARRQNHRVISEDESSYEGSSSDSNQSARFAESDETSEWQSDWFSSSESETKSPTKRKALGKAKTRKAPKILSSDPESDSSDEQLEKCPICLLPFRRQQVGTPSSCEHCFCLECLLEWSKNINTCPVDRQTFTVIHVKDKLGGQVTRHVPVEVPQVEVQPQEDPTFCEVCRHCDREDRMLLCDGCDSGYHLECLTPPINEVPMEEWFCPECSQNSQFDAEVVEIDLDEISDLMEEARRLGVSYGRTRTGVAPQENQTRMVPRTRHTERVRANIRRRNRFYDNTQPVAQSSFDPNQPSTSSGLDSFGDNSRSRSPLNASNTFYAGERNTTKRSKKSEDIDSESSDEDSKKSSKKCDKKNSPKKSDEKKPGGRERKPGSSSKKSGSKARKSGKRSRKTGGRSGKRKGGGSRNVESRGVLLREVRITEFNENGEQEEIVTYVKVAPTGTRRRTKIRKRRKRRRQARTVSSVLASSRKRLASSLGMCKPIKNVPVLVPSVRNRAILSEGSALTSSRVAAGIARISLFGDGLGLDYSPPGSDVEDYHASSGPMLSIHRRSAIQSRRRLRLKTIMNPQEPQPDLLSSIITSQEIWHSKKNTAVLKAEGLLIAPKKDAASCSPKKERTEEPRCAKTEEKVSKTDAPLEVTGINPELITQAPMYNNPCGSGNRGNFRGGYRDNARHSHGGQTYGRDSLAGGGRHSYGGGGNNFGRDFGPPGFYNPSFECRPPMFGGSPPFRNRNPQQFRNERYRFAPPERPQFFADGFERNPFNERFCRPRHPCVPPNHPQNNLPPQPPEEPPYRLSVEQQAQNPENSAVRQEEDCDIYCDIESKSDADLQDQQNGAMALLPPPEPPSGLLEFEENSPSDKDSDQELVIDDSHKEDTPKNDKYDPFSVESDSEGEKKSDGKSEEKEEKAQGRSTDGGETIEAPVRLTAYDDDEDSSDSPVDCPNFSIYSSQTIDVARHTQEQMSQQIGPLEPPPIPPSIPDDDDVIVGDVEACDLTDIPEPSLPSAISTPPAISMHVAPCAPSAPSAPSAHSAPSTLYIEALRKERQQLSKIPPKKISNDSRGKITFKIGTKIRLNSRVVVGVQPVEEEIEAKKVETERQKDEDNSIDRAEERQKITQTKTDEAENIKPETSSFRESSECKIFENKAKIREDEEEEEEEEEDEEDEEEDEVSTAVRREEQEQDQEEENEEDEDEPRAIVEGKNPEVSKIETAEKSSDSIFSLQMSPKKMENELSIDCTSEEGSEAFSKHDSSEKGSKEACKALEERRGNERIKEQDDIESEREEGEEKPDEEDEEEEDEDDDDDDDDVEEEERFPIEKEGEKIEVIEPTTWDSDGAYTPCKDELHQVAAKPSAESLPPFEMGLEPITPTKDKPDDLDSCRTPVDYNVLGTEAISETDEPMNFEDELTLLSLRREKEMEDGEILEEKSTKEPEKLDKDDEKKRKKKEKKEKSSKDSEKNKENIASENQVAWKKLSKSTKERSYRDKEKRSKSKEREKPKKKKEIVKKKEKRKELPRYDVRKIVAEKPSRPRKDEYGRDIREKSRQRSRSRSSSKGSRSYSKLRSRSRSRPRTHRSWSRDRRSYSKSLSRRRSLSRGRRKSPKRRSISRRRSTSRKRSISRRRSRSLSRKRRSRRSISRSRQRRSASRSRRSLSRSRDRRKDKKKYKSRSRSRIRNKRSSRSKSPRKSSKSRERKHSKRKAPSRSRSKGRSCSRNWEQVEKILEQNFTRERAEREERESWSGQWTPSWSRSGSKSPQHVQEERLGSRDWSPVLENVSVPPKNLTVILTNKEAIKKKKKERRKEGKKTKDEKKRKAKRNRTPPPSKEVFASGDNILVSVCFNKDNETNQTVVPELPETIPLIAPPIKRRRREPLTVDPPKRSKKEKTKDKRSKSPKPKKDKKKKSKAAEIAATKKPVAVIDLDQSPFREQTPSPRDVIVLSDDDDKQVQQTSPDQCQPSQNSPQRDQFVSQGPKTPPEPQIKFSINKQTSNLRPSMLNPLLEEEEEMDERVQEELEMRAQEELELRLKIGPNTPPEPPTSPPTSPDAYDPFDPTKSRSPTPDASQEANSSDERRRSPRKHDSVDGNMEAEEAEKQERQSQEKQIEKPKIISMVTIKRAATPQRDDSNENESNKEAVASTTNLETNLSLQQSQQSNPSQGSHPFVSMNPVLATVAAAVQRSGVFNAANSATGQRNLIQSNRISPSNQQKQRSNDRPQTAAGFANSGKPSGRSAKSGQNKTNGQNGNDPGNEGTENVDMSSPYSPGSTLSDGMFDPPSPNNFNNSPGAAAGAGSAAAGPTGSQGTKNANPKTTKAADKKDTFDALFGILPATKTVNKTTRSKKVDKEKKKKRKLEIAQSATNPKVGVRMDENQLQILDDLPSSAVEMQVKDKFLKKLNRQERVVEEVKLVLKPHYTKKHVTKEEYKDIMRKAVPKICHNKTGEINPKKIAHLIEAYVRKCRTSKKKTTESSSAKGSKPPKVMWS